MTVTGGSSLPKDEVDRMRQEAEQYADEDHSRREAAETRNQGEQLVYQTEKFLEDNEDKVPGDVKTEVEAAVAELKDDAQGRGHRRDPQATEKVAAVCRSSARRCTPTPRPRGAPGAAGAAGGAEAAKADDDVVDAEIVDDEQQGRCRVTEETRASTRSPTSPPAPTADDAEPKAAGPPPRRAAAAPAGDASADGRSDGRSWTRCAPRSTSAPRTSSASRPSTRTTAAGSSGTGSRSRRSPSRTS